jgi:hypothetical protein
MCLLIDSSVIQPAKRVHCAVTWGVYFDDFFFFFLRNRYHRTQGCSRVHHCCQHRVHGWHMYPSTVHVSTRDRVGEGGIFNSQWKASIFSEFWVAAL